MHKLIESIRNEPEKWRQTKFCLQHEYGAAIWTANGLGSYQPYPSASGFSFMDKIQFKSAYKYWGRVAPPEAYGA
jgi:hypothetical protein